MSDNPLVFIRASHLLCTHSSGPADTGTHRANCSCGAVFQWFGREAEHAAHVDSMTMEHFAAREDATWREAMLEAAEIVENAGDYGEGGWIEDDTRSAAYRLRILAEEAK